MSRETSEDGVSTYGTTTFASTRSDIGDGEVFTGQARGKAGTRYTAYAGFLILPQVLSICSRSWRRTLMGLRTPASGLHPRLHRPSEAQRLVN